MKMIEVKLSWMVYLFCAIGCSIQIYHLTCNYLKFKVRHEVTYDYAEQVELPTIDIIIPMVMSINLTELFIRYPEQMIMLCKEYMKKEVNYTIDSINSECVYEFKKAAFFASTTIASFIKVKDINELTIDPRDQIDYIRIGNVNVTSEQCKMTRYYAGLAILLRISCTEQAEQIIDRIKKVGSSEGNIATIGHLFGSYFGIKFTSKFDKPEFTTNFSPYFMVIQKADEMQSAWVRYKKVVSRSLPYPYETNCRYYNKLKVLSDCKVKQSFHHGFLMRDIVNEWDSQPAHFGFNSELSIIEDIKSHCAEFPFLECEKTTYITLGKIKSEKVNHTSGLIFIEKPETPIDYLNVYPEFLLSEYLISVASIVATWFVFSMFDRLILILLWIKSKVIERIRKSRESKSPIKLFTIRKSQNFSSPLLHSKSGSSRCASHSSIDTLRSIREPTRNN